ncbi:caspase family protein [Flavobacterium supellecticarium]|uniref:Caspase family protein n=1 Tax=Flavobacterium supellecticarium TaxID=2565924 RepID=A0A4S4A3Y1_9FLAO|nr:caspase family protein [Flavobacterium supellecticarium]THF53008.1 caspase family protein [Flavobacterium supellecticarium]
MNKIALCIGVDVVKGLTPLNKAADSARKFSEWAKKQEYDTELFIDSEVKKVNRRQILDRMASILDSRKYEQLIIFFSGHGVMRSLRNEVWLLSDANYDGSEMVDVRGTIDMAREAGIPHVLIISDACRTFTKGSSFNYGQGDIFPISKMGSNSSTVDVLYACRPGKPALEVKEEEWYGVFAETLLDVLEGNQPKSIKESSDDPKYWFISAYELKETLPDLVQAKVIAIGSKLDQKPDVTVEYINPKPPISKFNKKPNNGLKSGGGAPPPPPNFNEVTALEQMEPGKISFEGLVLLPVEKEETQQEKIDKISEQISKGEPVDLNFSYNRALVKPFKLAGNRQNNSISIDFPFQKSDYGFTVKGIKVKEVWVEGGKCTIKERIFKNKIFVTDILIPSDIESSNGLLVLENGCSLPLAILKGYIGVLVFKDERLLTINYKPVQRNEHAYRTYLENIDKIEEARSFVAYAANEGFDYSKVFSNVFNSKNQFDFDDAGSFLRIGKSLDPSLALYASYAFRQEGKFDKIKSVLTYLRFDNSTILFDVAMLGNELYEHNLASQCPLMSAGWSYQHLFKDRVASEFIDSSKYLDTGLWTMFKPEGTAILMKIINQQI